MLKVEQTSGGYKNITLQIRGLLTEGDMPVTEVKCPSNSVRLESVLWVVQEKLIVQFGWAKDDPFFTMESRNTVRFDVGIHSPKEWDGSLWFWTFGYSNPATPSKQFFIVLDFDK